MNAPNPNDHRFVSRLREEVAAWQRDGAVTAEQAQAILARYPDFPPGHEASRRRQGLVTGLSILGGILIGLSIISFYAANWDDIPTSVKLASLVAAMLLAYGASYVIWRRDGPSPYAVSFALLGCIVYGAGVHLIAQIYHVSVDHPNLTLAWFLGVAPLAYATRSRPIMLLAIALFLAAVGFRLEGWLRGLDELVAVAGLYILLGAFLYAVGRAKARFAGWEATGGLFQAVGLITAFAALYPLTFHDVFRDAVTITGVSLSYWTLSYGASAIAVAVVAGLAWRRARRGEQAWPGYAEAAAIAVLLAAIHVAGRVTVDWEPLYPIVFNALFALLALALMASGYLRDHEGRVNLSMALIAVYIITRYFEFSLDLLDSSLVFLGAGVILLAGGYLLDRSRRRMLATMREREGAP